MNDILRCLKVLENAYNDNKPLAIIIKGNPDRMIGQENIANTFYQEIEAYLNDNGFDVEFDDGSPYTCPKQADVWIGHSRGVDRLQCIDENDHNKFAQLGVIGGAIANDDEDWQIHIAEKYKNTTIPENEQPPESHFIFNDEMKKEVDRVIDEYKSALT